MTPTDAHRQALMFSATMRLEDSLVDETRREQFVDRILAVSHTHTPNSAGLDHLVRSLLR